MILDIRNTREWEASYIPESLSIPLNHIQEGLAEVPRGARIAVHCAGGYRSSIAISILHQYGITNLKEMVGRTCLMGRHQITGRLRDVTEHVRS